MDDLLKLEAIKLVFDLIGTDEVRSGRRQLRENKRDPKSIGEIQLRSIVRALIALDRVAYLKIENLIPDSVFTVLMPGLFEAEWEAGKAIVFHLRSTTTNKTFCNSLQKLIDSGSIKKMQ